jgi:hypothetical protein
LKVGLLTIVLAVTCEAFASTQQRSASAAAFERLRVLVGTWDVGERGGAGAGGQTATYAMASRSTAMVESLLSPSGAIGMMTVYNVDGDRLMLTHYCGAGNHPRMTMKAVEDNGRRLKFEMIDITNLADREAYHSTSVDVVFLSDDRVDLEYRGMTAGRESTQVFQLTRRRSTE